MAIDVPVKLQDEFSRQWNSLVGNINKQSATLDNTMKGLGTAIGAAFSIAGISSFMKTAADANLQVAKLDQSLANSGLSKYKNELLQTADTLRNKTAVDDDEIVKLQSMLVGYTGNINAVRQLTPAILDLAAGTGMSVEAAAKLVARSNEGQEGLKRLGIEIGKTTSEEERLAIITEEVTKRYGGMAEAFANTDAGGIQKLGNAMEDLQESAGNVFLKVLQPSLPGILKMFEGLAWLVDKIFLSLKVGVATIMTSLIAPLAAAENMMNQLGITSSFTLQNLMKSGMDQVVEASNQLMGGVENVDKAIATTGEVTATTTQATQSLKEQIKELKTELDNLTPGTNEYIQKLYELTTAQNEYNAAVQRSKDAVFDMINPVVTKMKTLPPMIQQSSTAWGVMAVKVRTEVGGAYDYVMKQQQQLFDSTIGNALGAQNVTMMFANSLREGLGAVFNNEEAAGKKFFKALVNNFISTAESAIAAYTSIGIAMGVPTFGASIPASLAILAGATTALEVARAIVNRFHEGGTMGAGGTRIPLRSDEYPAILQVGETVLPRNSVTNNSSSSSVTNNFVLNFNGGRTSKDEMLKGLKQLVRETGMTINQLVVDDSAGVSLSY